VKNRNNSDGTLVRKPEKIDSISLTNEGGPPRLQCGNYFFYYLQNKKSVLGESRQIQFRNDWHWWKIFSLGFPIFGSRERQKYDVDFTFGDTLVSYTKQREIESMIESWRIWKKCYQGNEKYVQEAPYDMCVIKRKYLEAMPESNWFNNEFLVFIIQWRIFQPYPCLSFISTRVGVTFDLFSLFQIIQSKTEIVHF
jgi:hypothetical protein